MTGRRCTACGVELNRYATQPVCPTCQVTSEPLQNLPARRLTPTVWLWASAATGTALATRDLGVILRTYRQINGITQEQLGALLGFDKTYVSMIETGRRVINDVVTRRHIARTLGLPTHVLGVTDTDDADFAAMLQFADSTIRLAEIARQSGRAVDAVNELWPLVARLEARASEGRVERDTLLLLAQARLSLGVSLGTVLPEERLATAASWTGKAVLVAEHLDAATAFLAHALRMHGNELRKADHTAAASARLQRATYLSSDVEGRGTAYALLARAAGERGDAALFDKSFRACHDLLDNNGGHGMIFNPFSLREIQLRGLMSTGRPHEAVHLVNAGQPDARPAAPQWQIIERVTTGQVLLAAGEPDGAREALGAALVAAETFRLPHQIQRTIRAAEVGGLEDVAADGAAALTRLSTLITSPEPSALP